MARVGRDHGLLRRCMVPPHGQLVTFEQAEVRGLTRSIPVVTVCSWTTACFRQEEYHAHGEGPLQSFVLHRGDRTGKSHGMQGRDNGITTRVYRHGDRPVLILTELDTILKS